MSQRLDDLRARIRHYEEFHELNDKVTRLEEEVARLQSFMPAPRLRLGDRVMWTTSCGLIGTVTSLSDHRGIQVSLDGNPAQPMLIPACDLMLLPSTPAPALPGEWRDYPDGPGWWVKRNPPSDEPHWVWERPLVYHQAEPAGYDGIH